MRAQYTAMASASSPTQPEGMPAKPIIDILVCPDRDVSLEDCIPDLERIGYRNLGEYGRPGRYFLSSGEEPGKTFYVTDLPPNLFSPIRGFTYDAAVSRYEVTKAEREQVAADIRQRGIRRQEFERFIMELEKLPEAVSEFDETLWGILVDYVTVGRDKTMVFTLIGGTEVKA